MSITSGEIESTSNHTLQEETLILIKVWEKGFSEGHWWNSPIINNQETKLYLMIKGKRRDFLDIFSSFFSLCLKKFNLILIRK